MCVCVSVSRGREECEFLHEDKDGLWLRGSEEEAPRGKPRREARERQTLRVPACFYMVMHYCLIMKRDSCTFVIQTRYRLRSRCEQ